MKFFAELSAAETSDKGGKTSDENVSYNCKIGRFYCNWNRSELAY